MEAGYTKMSAEILPCPVCGKPCRLTAALVGTSFYVLCGTECAYSGTRGNLIDATIAAHNAIASAVADRDRLAAEVEALKAQDGRLFVAARMQQDGEQLCAVANDGRLTFRGYVDLHDSIAARWAAEAPEMAAECWDGYQLQDFARAIRDAALAATAPQEVADGD